MATPRAEVVWAVVGADTGLPYVWTTAYTERAAKTRFIHRTHHASGRRIDIDEEWRRHESAGFTVQQFDMVLRST